MKLLLLMLLICQSTNAQSIEAKLKAKVLKIETDKISKYGQPPTDAQFASFHYKRMPIKVKWDKFYEVDMTFRGRMNSVFDKPTSQLLDQLIQQDKLKGTHQADSLQAALIRQEYEKSPKEAFLKEKYGNADPNRQIYEVTYVIKYNRNGQEVRGDKQVRDFYQDDLSEVHYRN